MNRERGQALILVLILLAVGSLLIIPSLRLTTTVLKGRTMYAQFIKEDYAADAAIEYGLWRLNWEPGFTDNWTVGENVTFEVTLNGVTANITITLQVTEGLSGVGLAGNHQIKPTKTVTPDTASPGVPRTFTFTVTLERLEPDDAVFDPLESIKDAMDVGFVYVPDSSALDGVPFLDDDLTILLEPVTVLPLNTLPWSRIADMDAMVTQVSPTQNYGDNLTMDVSSGVPSSNETALSFLHFDVSSLPADVVIYSAALRLWPAAVPAVTRTYDVHLMTDNWTESSVTWDNQPAVSANLTDSATTPPSANTTMEWNVTADVLAWVVGTTTNYGWRIRDDAEGFGNENYTSTVIDTLEFDTSKGLEPSIIPIFGNVYAIAYHGDADDGFLKTVKITPGGNINSTVVDTLEFDTSKGLAPDIIPISGDVYAIAYRGDDDDGFLKTVDIATNGNITDAVIDTLEFDTLKGLAPDIIPISGDVYAIAYAGDGDDGFLKTVQIASSGNITDTVIDTLEFDTLKGKTPDIINVSGDVYAIAYAGDGDDGFLKTVQIVPSGNITDTVIDALEFDTLKGLEPNIIPISGDVYAIAYGGDRDDGYLKTVEIASNGQITDAVIDTLEFDTLKGLEPNIIPISGDAYVIAYRGDADDGFLKTVTIANSGDIRDTLLTGTPEFDTLKGKTPDIIPISGDVYAIAYGGDGDDGFLKTVDIVFSNYINHTTVFYTREDDESLKEPELLVEYIPLGGSDFQTIEWKFNPNLDFDYGEERTLSFQARATLADDTRYWDAVQIKPHDSYTGLTAPITVGTPSDNGTPGAGITVTKTSDPPIIYPGMPTLVTYVISITNNDIGDFSKFDFIEDFLPPGFTYVDGSASAAWSDNNSTENPFYPYNICDFEPVVTENITGRDKLKWHGTVSANIPPGEPGVKLCHDRPLPQGVTYTQTFQALADLPESGSYQNEVFVKLKDWNIYGNRGIGSKTFYSWATGSAIVPAYDILVETDLSTLRAGTSVTVGDITIRSWHWKKHR